MGVVIPDDIRVLSSEFKDFVLELASEINRVSEAYADLQRVRANTDGIGTGGGGQAELLFYKVNSDGGTPTDEEVSVSGGIGSTISTKVYSGGTVFSFDGSAATVVASNVDGYDFGMQRNDPITIPPQAEILQGDPLEGGTVILCTLVNATTAAFSSVKPRLSVDCVQ